MLISDTVDLLSLHYAKRSDSLIVLLRWLSMVSVLVLLNTLGRGLPHLFWLNVLIGCAAVYNLLATIALRRPRRNLGWSYTMALFDALLITVACAMAGGLDSSLRYLYFLCLTAVAMRFTLKASMAFAAFYCALYWLIAVWQPPTLDGARDALLLTSTVLLETFAVSVLSDLVVRSRRKLETLIKARTEELAQRTEELKRANEHLLELDRLKSGFVSAVSHELRTPLTSIRGFAEFLEDEVGGELTKDQTYFVQQIQMGTQRLQHIVDDLLDFARLEAGTFRLQWHEFDLAAKVREAIASLEPQARSARLALAIGVAPPEAIVSGDPDRIGQVLINLVNNAIKFTPPGGVITVRVSAVPEAWRVEVEDTGIGILHEHLPRLFDKFYQVDPSSTRQYGGAGLGLSICKSLIEAHGSTLMVASTLGDGSRFWFELSSTPVLEPGRMPTPR